MTQFLKDRNRTDRMPDFTPRFRNRTDHPAVADFYRSIFYCKIAFDAERDDSWREIKDVMAKAHIICRRARALILDDAWQLPLYALYWVVVLHPQS